ncbi:Stp1/IreP family PP2C-type Ser/Thr phosphatase [Faecalimonas sp.]
MKIFSLTDIGRKREVNQDYVYVTDKPVGHIPNLFVVADGMGGHKAGDFASKYAVQVLEEHIRNNSGMGPEVIITEAVQEANHKIVEKARENTEMEGMGTTLVVATIIEHTLYFANVGDSRLYLIRDEIKQLSKDHSLVEEMVRLGGLNEEEAKHHPDKNIITRAIGAKEDVEADFFEYHLQKGDIILMCTDGLTNMVDDNEIFKIVKSGRDIVETAMKLVEKANENGGKDNIGIVLVEPFVCEVNV